MKYLLLTCLALAELSLLCLCEQPYTVTNEALEPFPGDEETFVDFRLKTIKRERFINGSVAMLEDMDSDAYKVQVELFSSPSGDGNYKRMPMGVPKTGVCEGFKDLYIQIVQPSLLFDENTNFPHVPDEGLCPVPTGEYFVKDIFFNTESWPNQIPRGIMKAVLTFFKNDVNVGGLVLKMKIEDRQN